MINCPICGTGFEEKTGRRPKKFCSEPCKIKFWNDKKSRKKEEPPKPMWLIPEGNTATKRERLKIPWIASTTVANDGTKGDNEAIQKQIESLIKERDSAPKEYSVVGKKVWRLDRQKKIDELKKLLV